MRVVSSPFGVWTAESAAVGNNEANVVLCGRVRVEADAVAVGTARVVRERRCALSKNFGSFRIGLTCCGRAGEVGSGGCVKADMGAIVLTRGLGVMD